MRTLIIEDDIIIARYFQQLLKEHFKCESRVAISIEEVEEIFPNYLPKLVLCDINLGDHMDGIELMGTLNKKYHFETIFVTSYHSKEMMMRAADSGPVNYLVKPVDESQFVAAVSLCFPRLNSSDVQGTVKLNIKQLLTKSEYRILELIAKEKSTPEIASEVFLSTATIKNHRHSIVQKLGLAADNKALVKWAMENKDLILNT
jgi:DNA-binding NarL/FixJ family response regulator